jgi:inosose dehydratase
MNPGFSRRKSVARRYFIKSLAGSAAAMTMIPSFAGAAGRKPAQQISSTSYPWLTFYRREGKEWLADPDASIRDFASSGLKAIEPAVSSLEELQALVPILKKYDIAMKSVYVGTTLHDPATSEQNINQAAQIAVAAKEWGVKIIVTNPSPISWGNPEDKDDAALTVQAASLEKLGAILAGHKLALAYHSHDMEMRQGAREFHHMLSSTDPRFVSFCLDVHWVYRGTGNSQVGLFDIVRMYGKRISELHIRQSRDHIWSEVFGPGDIDYPTLVTELVRLKVQPNLVLEQCLEDKSPNTTTAANAHRLGLEYAREVFAPLLT